MRKRSEKLRGYKQVLAGLWTKVPLPVLPRRSMQLGSDEQRDAGGEVESAEVVQAIAGASTYTQPLAEPRLVTIFDHNTNRNNGCMES